ncbi:hypothetical protein HDV05_002892 [Chytridiales sp. JEL 0842]|nr:hypothetical protein HDV05_002892 [Chytridiales sp. JEL 0842]
MDASSLALASYIQRRADPLSSDSGSFSTPPPFLHQSAVVSIDNGNGIFVMGGYLLNKTTDGVNSIAPIPDQCLNLVYYFDSWNKTWSIPPAAQLPEGLCGHTATVYKDHIWIVGGTNNAVLQISTQPNLNEKIFAFNYKTNQWSTKLLSSPLATARYNHVAEVYEPTGNLFVFGGQLGFFSSINNLTMVALDTQIETLTTTELNSAWAASFPQPLQRTQASSFKISSFNMFTGTTNNVMFIYGGVNSSYTSTSASLNILSGQNSWLAIDMLYGVPAVGVDFIPYSRYTPPSRATSPTTIRQTRTASASSMQASATGLPPTPTPTSRFPWASGQVLTPEEMLTVYGPALNESSLIANFAFVFNTSMSASGTTERAYLYGGGLGDQMTNSFWALNTGVDGAWNWTRLVPSTDNGAGEIPVAAGAKGAVVRGELVFFIPYTSTSTKGGMMTYNPTSNSWTLVEPSMPVTGDLRPSTPYAGQFTLGPAYIAIIAVAGALVVGLSVFAGVQLHRRKRMMREASELKGKKPMRDGNDESGVGGLPIASSDATLANNNVGNPDGVYIQMQTISIPSDSSGSRAPSSLASGSQSRNTTPQGIHDNTAFLTASHTVPQSLPTNGSSTSLVSMGSSSHPSPPSAMLTMPPPTARLNSGNSGFVPPARTVTANLAPPRVQATFPAMPSLAAEDDDEVCLPSYEDVLIRRGAPRQTDGRQAEDIPSAEVVSNQAPGTNSPQPTTETQQQQQQQQQQLGGQRCIVMVAHIPVGKEEIELRVGDHITLTPSDPSLHSNSSFVRGLNHDSGRTGLFPRGNVVMLDSNGGRGVLPGVGAADISWWREQAMRFHPPAPGSKDSTPTPAGETTPLGNQQPPQLVHSNNSNGNLHSMTSPPTSIISPAQPITSPFAFTSPRSRSGVNLAALVSPVRPASPIQIQQPPIRSTTARLPFHMSDDDIPDALPVGAETGFDHIPDALPVSETDFDHIPLASSIPINNNGTNPPSNPPSLNGTPPSSFVGPLARSDSFPSGIIGPLAPVLRNSGNNSASRLAESRSLGDIGALLGSQQHRGP